MDEINIFKVLVILMKHSDKCTFDNYIFSNKPLNILPLFILRELLIKLKNKFDKIDMLFFFIKRTWCRRGTSDIFGQKFRDKNKNDVQDMIKICMAMPPLSTKHVIITTRNFFLQAPISV